MEKVQDEKLWKKIHQMKSGINNIIDKRDGD